MAANRSRLRAMALALATALIACDAPTTTAPAFAYDPTTLSDGTRYRWAGGRSVRVLVVDQAVAAADLERAVRAAMLAWNREARFGEFALSVTTDPAEANIVVFDGSRALPVRPARCPFDARAAVGYTYFCGDGERAERLALASGVASNISVVIRVDRSQVADQPGLDAIVAHEFGHALGIGAHSGDAADLMFGLPRVRAPSARDARTLHFVLAAPADLLL